MADGSTPWCTLEWLDPAFGYLSKKSSGRFSYGVGVPLDSECNLVSEGAKIVSYQLKTTNTKKKSLEFDDVFLFVEHLMFKEDITDHESIRQHITDSRVLKEIHTLPKTKKLGLQLLTSPPRSNELPTRYSEDNRSDIEQTLLEMTNYATKCITEGYIYIDEHQNLDTTDLLPTSAMLEPSTDHTSSKKKEKHRGLTYDDPHVAPARDLSKSGDLDLSNLHLVKQDDGSNKASANMEIKRRLMKTAGPSPDREGKRSINIGEESTPKVRDFEKFLGKRKPEQVIQPMRQMEIMQMSNKKPSYKSRNASPPKAVKLLILEENHPLYRNIDTSKTVDDKKKAEKTKNVQPESQGNSMSNQLNGKKEMIKDEPVANAYHQKATLAVPVQTLAQYDRYKQENTSKISSNTHQIQMPSRTIVPSAPRVKQPCEQRTELTHWPAQVDAQKPKIEKPSMFSNPNGKQGGFSRETIERFMQKSMLRNMSGPPTRAGERVSK